MKLIHSGKVLKDDDVIESCNIKPNDFLVVMIAKAKKAVVKPSAAASAATEPSTPAASAGIPPTPAAPAPVATTAASTPAATAAASNVSSPDEFPAEVVNNLIALGFPESSVRACLRASDGNPDIAVEFLMNGVPPELEGGDAAAVASSGGSSSSGGSGGAGGPLEALRSHPQFDALRRLVQSNPAMLQAVLSQIGQQQPELLTAINANQSAFLEMMNEPVVDAPAAPVAPVLPRAGAGGAANPFASVPGMEALGNPVQLAQMLQGMPPQEQQAMAQMMGMDVTQLQHLAQMIGAMPPEQVQQHMNMAMQQQGLGGLMGRGGGGGVGGAQVLRLSEEEMAAVDRLTEMGFDRSEAAQAYLACDKNEALAANLLMDGGFGGFGGDGDDDLGGGDDMYD
jgi:UV excision repair protein RAD23